VEQRTAELSQSNHALGCEVKQREKREADLQKVNRTLKALRNSNEAMTRANNEPEYLKAVCKVLTDDCGYALVWIAFAEQDEEKSIRPVAYAGFEEGYLENLKLSWGDTPYGQGPAGKGVRTGKPCKCANILTDPAFEPWRAEAIKRGYASTITVPILEDGKAFGAFAVYAKDPDAFTDEETNLLVQLADDLAYGIEAIRLRIARAKEEAEKEQLLREVQGALAHVKTLRGLLPICSGCKKIRDDKGYWNQIETYVSQHSEAEFSHGLCPECSKQYFPDYDPSQEEENDAD
jgi:signal transduction protein with GAF and PtsI domain